MKIICISGKAQHGKDTAGNMLKDQLEKIGERVLITHYADILKYICANYFRWDGNKDEYGRYLLQHVGTDLIRNENPDFFTNFMAYALTLCYDKWDYVIIPDCRFPNELENLINIGFKVTHIRVIRNGYEPVLSKKQQNHISETALDDVVPDYYLYNDGTLDDLRKCVLDIFNRIYL